MDNTAHTMEGLKRSHDRLLWTMRGYLSTAAHNLSVELWECRGIRADESLLAEHIALLLAASLREEHRG